MDICSLCGKEIGTPATYLPTYENKVVDKSHEHVMSPVCNHCVDFLEASHYDKTIEVEDVIKTYHLFDCFIGPLGGKYSLWIKEKKIVSIHDDDDELVSVFDLNLEMYPFLDEKTKKGLGLIEKYV